MKNINYPRNFFFLLVLLLSFNGQSQIVDYGTFAIHQNPKKQEVFTNVKMEEVRAEVELRRQDDIEIVWQITEFTYIVIEPRGESKLNIKTEQ